MPNNLLGSVIGQRIRAARRKANLTLAEVSKRIGISNQALSAIERGKKNPSKQTLMSLARVFGRHFGEVWLADYLAEIQSEFQLVATPQGPDLLKENLMQLFEEFLDTKYGTGKVKVVPDPKERTVSIPISYEILKAGIKFINNDEEYIEVPPQMFPPDKGANAGIVKSKSLRDAFVDEGDFVVLTLAPDSINGKTILAIVNNEAMIKRCQVKGDKVILRSIDESFGTIKVPVKEIVCMGEVTGIIRIIERSVFD